MKIPATGRDSIVSPKTPRKMFMLLTFSRFMIFSRHVNEYRNPVFVAFFLSIAMNVAGDSVIFLCVFMLMFKSTFGRIDIPCSGTTDKQRRTRGVCRMREIRIMDQTLRDALSSAQGTPSRRIKSEL